MFEEQELEYRNQDSSAGDEVTFPEEPGELYGTDYAPPDNSQGDGINWENCAETLEEEEESVEFLLDHEEGRAVMMPEADPDELEENYSPERYQVMGRRREIDTTEEYEWEPIHDLSGATENQKMMANLVAGIGAGGFRAAEGIGKSIFGILSSLAS